MANPGPSSVVTVNTGLAQQPFNLPQSAAFPMTTNALRCIAEVRACPLSATGDIIVPVNNSSSFVPTTIVVANGLVNGASASVAAANLGIFSAAGATGTTIRTAGVLTGQTSTTVATVNASPSVAIAIPISTASPNIFVNITATVAGGTVDLFVYGYDLS